MLFNSYHFLFVFLPLVLLGFYALRLRSQRAGLAWITLSSLFFYGYWDYRYLLLIISSILFNCGLGYLIARSRQRSSFWLIVGIGINLAVIGWFKYSLFIFMLATQGAMETPEFLKSIVLPLGISFFTFQQIAYLVNVRRGLETPAPLETHAFIVLFFPHLIAGPIVLYENIRAQVKRNRFRPGYFSACFCVGLLLFSIGLFKKVIIADSLAPFVNDIFNFAMRPDSLVLFTDSVLGALGYSLQLYFDFSAYSDMAIGLAMMFGLKLPMNFNSPYKATSIIEFWRRWHITLSLFFRNYVYIPLGGRRKGFSSQVVFIMVVFLLTGLWHGAAWTFVIWGLLHGVLVVINHLWAQCGWAKKWRQSESNVIRSGHAFLAWLLTMAAVVALWVLFRADSWSTVEKFGLAIVQGQFKGIHTFPDMNVYYLFVSAIIFLWLCSIFLPNSLQLVRWLRRQVNISSQSPSIGSCRVLVFPAVTAFCLYLAVASISHVRSDFLYFNF